MPEQPADDPVRTPDGHPAPAAPQRRLSDASPLNWLLLVPIAICLAVPFYNRVEPTLGGIPFFYWFQLLIIPIGVTCTLVVFLAHRGDGRKDS